ncbi:MAG: hypothetical protein KAH32_07605 [Chlamydiia bacterium]|nr:hypothetical protein [Chlamydiia bacterium]
MNKKVTVITTLFSFIALVVNGWFFGAFIISALCIMYSGHIISVVAGVSHVL